MRLTLLLGLILCLNACLGQVYKVGAVLPLTGSLQSTGVIYNQAYELIFQLINNINSNFSSTPFSSYKDFKGVIPTFEFIALDDESDPQKAIEQVNILASQYNVDAILGGFSNMIVERQAEASNAHGIPFVNGGGASSAIYTSQRPWVFGVMASMNSLGSSVLTMLKDLIFRSLLPKPCKLVLIYEDSYLGSDFLRGVSSFINRTENRGYFTMSANSSFEYGESGEENKTALFALNAFSTFEPDVLLIDASLNDFIHIHQAITRMGTLKYKLVSYGARGGEVEAINALGQSLNGLIFGTWWSNKYENDQSENIKSIWSNSSTTLPLDYRAACAYEAARVLVTAVISTQSFTRDKVRDALTQIFLKDSLVLQEELRFNPYGQADYDFAFEQVFFKDSFSTKFIYPLSIKETDPTILNYSPIPAPKEKLDKSLALYIGIPLGALGVILFVMVVYCSLKSKRSKKDNPDVEMQQPAKTSMFRKRKLPAGSKLVSKEEFPLLLSTWDIDLGLAGGQCPVESVMSQTLTITNRSKHSIYFQFILPPKTHKAEIQFNPIFGKIKKKQVMDVRVSIQFFCTAKWITQPLLTATKSLEGDKKVHCPLDLKLDSMLSTKLSFDEVEIEGPAIGEGSYGTVYKGEWRGLKVAVKKLKVQEGFMYPEALLDELTREISIMSTLRHPNIINFIGASLVPDHLFLVTEFIPLGNLGQYLNNKNHIRTVLKIKIALDCARGMDFLHKCNILHRDLKPDNLLVLSMSRSAPTNVKLTDFGTARAVTLTITKATQMTVGLGTPIYMAPEVMLGDYDQKSDVFSFAILLFELCTQTTPYSRFSRGYKVANFVTSGHRLPIPPTVPTFFSELISKCWAENAAQRPRFSEIVEELEGLYMRAKQPDLTEEFSVRDLSKKSRSRSTSGPKFMREHTVTELANVFSNPCSPSVEFNLIDKLNNLNNNNNTSDNNSSSNSNNNNSNNNNNEDNSSLHGTTTSSTFSNVMSFNSTLGDNENNNNNNSNNKVILRRQTKIEDMEESEETEREMEAEEAVKYSVCSVCNSVSSSSSKSSSVSSFTKSRSGNGSKSRSGGSLREEAVQTTPASPNVIEEAIANLESFSKSGRRNIQATQQITSPRSYLMREESKQRIEKVLAALSADKVIHEVKLDEKEEETRQREEIIEEIIEEIQQKTSPLLPPVEEIEEEEVEEEEEEEEGEIIDELPEITLDIEEEEYGEIEEEEEEREIEKNLRSRILDQQHSDNAIQRPQKYHFASEFASFSENSPSSSQEITIFQDKDEK